MTRRRRFQLAASLSALALPPIRDSTPQRPRPFMGHLFSAARENKPLKTVGRKPPVAKLRSWRVSMIRKRAQYLGTVEAPNEKAAEAAAVAEFDLSDEQRRRLVVKERQ
jgi:hypothetical protein